MTRRTRRASRAETLDAGRRRTQTRSRTTARVCAPRCRRLALCAVVKADGYGHGAGRAPRPPCAAGATWLAVATVVEATELRDAGIQAPILIMGALSDRAEIEWAIELGPTSCCGESAPWRSPPSRRADRGLARVHVKLDTGMGRLGTRDLAEASRVVAAAAAAPGVRLAGVMTHFATADIPDDDGFFERQLAASPTGPPRSRPSIPSVLVHAANSAAVLREPRSAPALTWPAAASPSTASTPSTRTPSRTSCEPALELQLLHSRGQALPGG